MSMFSHGCRSDLIRIADPQDAPPTDLDGVFYRSDGHVAILCDGPDMAARALVHLTGHGALLVVAPRLDALAEPDVTVAAGRATRVEGWLGAFCLTVASPQGDESQYDVDVILDLCALRIVDRDVPPIGYVSVETFGDEAIRHACDHAVSLTGLFRKPKYFRYTPEICAHDVFGQTGCTRCLDVCAADAIRSENRQIAVEPHLCQGCAACTLACPTGALSSARSSRDTVLAAMHDALARSEPGSAVLVAHIPAQTAKVSAAAPDALPIIAAVTPLFGEELWFAALAEGAGKVVVLDDPAAPAQTRALMADRLAVASAIADALGLGADAIQCAAPEALTEAARAPSSSPRLRRPLPPIDPQRKRDLLNAALDRLEPLDGFASTGLPEGACLGAIEVDPAACVMCSICARSCPTASIRYVEGERVALQFAEMNCVQCGLCARICPENAIVLTPRIAPKAERGAWRTLNDCEKSACTACGTPFIAAPLLASILRKTEGQADIAPELLEQMRRCPECRHGGANMRF
jgi:ferredoxin